MHLRDTENLIIEVYNKIETFIKLIDHENSKRSKPRK